MNRAVLLLGTNVGERFINLGQALDEIKKSMGKISRQSSIYETAPWGNTHQEKFLNQVVMIETNLAVEDVMNSIFAIEKKMGRVRKEKWEPRIIDIDILFYNDEIISTAHLQVPHPSLHLRKFTLIPLAELMPDFVHPLISKTIAALLNEVTDRLEVKKISHTIT
jgi:2-amino-4-hydroxy-6-hydroxymethyldihydropteridine diphosphokinase